MHVSLGEIGEFVNGAAFGPEDWSSVGKRIVRIQNLTDDSKEYNRTTRVVPDKVLVHPGDLLVSWSASLGVFEWAGPDVGVLNQHIFRVLPDERRVAKIYLRHALRQAIEDMKHHLHGATMQHVNRGEFLSTPLYLPPLPEQRRIAAILDKAEVLRIMRREALAQLDSLSRSIFLTMFGDLTTNMNGWRRVALEEVADVVTGYAFRSDDYSSAGSGIRLCRGTNVLPGRIDWTDLATWPESNAEDFEGFRLLPGDVVLAMDRPWIAEGFKVARVNPEDCPALLVQRVARLRGKNGAANQFLFHVLKQAAFTRHCRPTETTVPHISPKEIRSFTFPAPPVERQQEFVHREAGIERLRCSYSKSLKESEALFASLQHRAFRGEL